MIRPASQPASSALVLPLATPDRVPASHPTAYECPPDQPTRALQGPRPRSAYPACRDLGVFDQGMRPRRDKPNIKKTCKSKSVLHSVPNTDQSNTLRASVRPERPITVSVF